MLFRREDSPSSSYQLSPSLFDFASEPDYSSLSDFSELPDDSFMSGQPSQFQDSFYWAQPGQYSQGQLFSSANPDYSFDFGGRQHGASGQPSREWQFHGDGSFVANPTAYSSPQPKLRPHRRALSNSTATSYASTSSPRQYHAAYDNSYLDPNVYGGHAQVHHYPTPTHTPTQDSFADQGNPRQARAGVNMERLPAAQRAMKNAGVAGDQNQQNAQQYYANSEYLATPKTTNGDYTDRQPPNGASLAMRHIPDLNRTMSDICQDELYNPPSNIVHTQAQPPHASSASLLSPHRVVMNNLLQAANEARTSTSPVDFKRENSPFRPTSPYASNQSYGPIQGGVGTAAGQRQQQKAEADVQAFRQHHMQPDDSAPKTISPQEAYLDHFHDPAEDSLSGPPLFPQGTASQQRVFDGGMNRGYGQLSEERRLQSSGFNFQSPPMQPTPQNQHQGGFKFDLMQQRQSGDSNEDMPTDFPAHLVSMETSKSEPELESSQEADIERPAGTTADGGTYTCTYQNCTRRFATPALLQKHKREGHRSTTTTAKTEPGSPTDRATSSASPPRNTQAGPHRCDRINPSTGKPCNTIFSRPYDLTRHEDTIHARRGKVQCQYCTEEKTFSRADALTRHMRVVHPTIDFPGKHRRRHE